MVTMGAFQPGLFASAETQHEAKSRNHKEAEQTPSPGKSPFGGNDLGIVTFGAEHIGSCCRNKYRYICRLCRLRNGLGNRLGRQLAAAAAAQAAGRIIGDLHTAVFTTHDHSSFLLIIGDAEEICNKVFLIQNKQTEVKMWQMKTRS